MAQPQAYNREVDFTERDGDDTNHTGINTELDAAALSINEIRDNLALIQADDGGLKAGVVTAESLSDSAFNAVLGEVATATAAASAAADRSVLYATQAESDRLAAQAAAAAAQTSETNASASATAAASSQTAAANSATSASTSASTATTKASEASTSETNAAASAASASTSATTATTKASEAATSATTATNAATTATTGANTATTKASEASASAAAAAASFDQFDDRYLGSKTADPTTDNDGNALVTGALYFNSVAGEMRVWAGTFWKATGSSVGGTINTAKYTATAGQTTFAIVYDVGFVHVYLNGVKLESGVEFTANNGTSVILATGATAGDVVDMIAFGVFSVANTYTKAETDTFLSAKANQATTYTKTEVDSALSGKLSASAGAVGTTNLADSAVTRAKAASDLLGVTQNSQSAAYTLALSDIGKHVYSANTGAQTVTIPTNASVAFPVGAAVSLVNNGTTAITVSTTGITLKQAGTTNTGNRTLGVNGLATLLKVGTDTWFITGAGLT